MSFLPLSLVIFGKIKNNIDFKTVITLLFVCMMMVGQPILGGPDASSRNVVRIATLCYPIILMAIFYIYDFKYFFNKKIIFFFIVDIFPYLVTAPNFFLYKYFFFFKILVRLNKMF